MELAYDTGQRQADILSLTWTQYDGTAFMVQQSKTAAKVVASVSPEMRARLATVKRTGVQVVIAEATGQPYKRMYFSHEFTRLRKLAGLPDDLQFRDLRRTAATELGQAGATDDQIRAQTGHKSRNVVSVYVVPERAMSEGGQEKRRAWRKRGENDESKS
ncbi:tyrosine-type recombinase/integrase [Azospirillum agricola]|uniref:tyrosine-type recombinase/integrase n=1 Tax=Azospirillum agricola TaxID=1720247 RepID=UPI000A0F0174|nr:tyrosine-type recombinase/integrase [Azospirillum agricola]SMH60475.1 Phage integrase family protein [Azospirillum lipoferum]